MYELHSLARCMFILRLQKTQNSNSSSYKNTIKVLQILGVSCLHFQQRNKILLLLSTVLQNREVLWVLAIFISEYFKVYLVFIPMLLSCSGNNGHVHVVSWHIMQVFYKSYYIFFLYVSCGLYHLIHMGFLEHGNVPLV